MTFARRRILQLAAGAAVSPFVLPFVSRIARAQAYPSRPVHLIVPFAPAGASDIIARIVGPALSERLGQQIVIENKAGAGGNIGTEIVTRAAPDGYTVLMVGGFNAINATLYDKLSFVFSRDIAPVASIARMPNVMEVNPSFPAHTVPEFIAYAKANPDKINFASGGTGSPTHMVGELFKMMTGIKMVHLPYRGAGPALIDLLGGQVEVMFATLPSSIGYIRGGKLRPLGVTFGVALRCGTGGSNDQRIRARLRRRRLVWHRRAQGHAGRDRRQAQPGYQRRPHRSQDEGSDGRPRNDGADFPHVCGLRRIHRR
jgi:tripartite-type tricarboxylate transporter receptor subunit TctC